MLSHEPFGIVQPVHTMQPNYYQNHVLNMHGHAGTGGHYNAVNINEDYSATSSYSNSSKRQRIDDFSIKYNNGGPFIS